MSKTVQRVRRDLDEIAERAPVSPAAWDSILSRAATSIGHSEREVVMLDKNTFTSPRRTWGIPVAIGIAAVAALAVAGVVIVRNTGDDADQIATVESVPAVPENDAGEVATIDSVPAVTADDATTAEQPTDTPVADEPATDEPATDEPATDEPATEQPALPEEPAVETFEQLVALPWASPDDTHATPEDAVRAFLGFMTERSVLPDSVHYAELTLGDFVATDDQSGEITVTGSEEAFHDVGQFEVPFSTVALRQSEGSWWVTGAISESLGLDEPAPDTVFAPPMIVSGVNGLFSNAIQLQAYVDGERQPLLAFYFTGGGVYAWGEYSIAVDPANPVPCEPEGPCVEVPEWQVPAASQHGTVVITDNTRMTTVRVGFGG